MAKHLEFTSEKNQKTKKVRRFIAGFVAFLVLFAVAVTVWFLNYIDFDLSNLTGNNNDPSSAYEGSEPSPEYEGFSYFLLCCAGENRDKSVSLRFTVVLKVDLGSKTVSVLSLSDGEFATVGSRTMTLGEHYAAGGITQLKRAVEAVRGVDISAYVLSDDAGFDDALNEIGTVSLEIPEQINYRSENFNFICAKGQKRFRGADLLKYLRYCRELGSDGLTTQEEIFAELLRQYITPNKTAKASSYYEDIIDSIESDVTVTAFALYKDKLAYLAADPVFTVWTAS